MLGKPTSVAWWRILYSAHIQRSERSRQRQQARSLVRLLTDALNSSVHRLETHSETELTPLLELLFLVKDGQTSR